MHIKTLDSAAPSTLTELDTITPTHVLRTRSSALFISWCFKKFANFVENSDRAMEIDDRVTEPESEVIDLPQKRYFRQRAHVNPIADHNFDYPLNPDVTDWSKHYVYDKEYQPYPKIRCLDVGCGFGGLLISLSCELDGDELALGMEIRTKVSDYVQKRIIALRTQHPGQFKNVWCLRTNAMRYIPNYIGKGQLRKMFFLFPDPHFKKTKHKWRIINDALLAEYAYVCSIGAIVYIATDVKELYDWMYEHFSKHPLFQSIDESELVEDKMIKLITSSTEESKKVERNEGDKFYAAFRRVSSKDITGMRSYIDQSICREH